MTNLVDHLTRKSKPQIPHDRQTIQEFAAASEALFLTDGFLKGERDSIRQSISDVTNEILDKKEDPTLGR